MSFTFYVHGNITFGRGALQKLPDLIRGTGAQTPMVIYDEGVEKAGIAAQVLEQVRAACKGCVVYDRVLPNPSDTLVDEAVALAKGEGADLFVAVGGGSSIDLAKAVNVLMTNPPPIHSYEGIGNVKNELGPLIAIPTTAGTSSEITNVSALIDTAHTRKMVVIDNKLTPTAIIVDPELTKTMPPSVTAGTGMDAITHALESYLSNMATPLTQYHSLEGFRILWQNLPRVMENGGDMDAREQMLLGCIITGFGFSNANLGLVHGIAHTLSAHFNLPHGLANATVLPYVMAFNATGSEDKMIALADCIGLPRSGNRQEDALLIAGEMKRLARLVGIGPLSNYGVGEGDVEMLADEVLKEPVLNFNPRGGITHSDITDILRQALS